MEKPFKLLIAIDASKYATEVIEKIQNRQWNRNTQILIVTVLEPDRIWEATHQYMHQCQILLDDHVRRLQQRLPDSKIAGECIEGKPASKIVELASDWSADLMVIGSHGDTGLRPDRVGSVAADIVNKAPCSVEVIKVAGRCTDKQTNQDQPLSSIAAK